MFLEKGNIMPKTGQFAI